MTIDEATPVFEFNLQGATLTGKPGSETGRIVANANSNVNLNGATVTSTGTAALALFNSSAVLDGSTIIAHAAPGNPSASAFGVRLSGIEHASSATISNSFVSGIDRGINVTDSASLVLANTTVEGHQGASSTGFVSGGAGVVVAGANAAITQNSHVSGDKNGLVMWADATGATEKGASVIIDQSSVAGRDGSAVVVTRSGVSDKPLDLSIRNGSTLFAGNGVILSVENGANGHIDVDNSQLVGDVNVSKGSVAALSLNNHASLSGKITNATSLNIDGSSQWTMEGDSSVGKLGLAGGTVDLRGSSAEFHTLTLGELAGAGTFALGTELATGRGDFLEITGAATGDHQLLVQNTGVDPVKGAGAQQVVHAASGDAQFSLIGKQVDFGTFAYELEQTNTDDGISWSLVQKFDDDGKPIVTPGTGSAIGLFSAAPSVWYGESSTLRSRMGELRNGNDQGGGWVRTYGNRQNMSAGAGVAYTQVQQGISFGADVPLSADDGQWLVGLTGGYSQSDLDLKQGTTGTVDSYYVGAYSTWLADDGFYVDALIKANRFQNQSDVRMSDGEKAKGKYHSVGVGASVEVGKHIKLDDEWFVEPFAQMSGLLVGGESYRLNNGMRASSNGADSLVGKAGTHVGRTFALDDGGFVQPYVKIAGAQEFVNGNKVKINDNRFSNDLSGARIELGTGVAAQLTDVLQVHSDFDYMKGRNIEQPWGVNVGVRYSW
jgi:outer membrane autotransporter protein